MHKEREELTQITPQSFKELQGPCFYKRTKASKSFKRDYKIIEGTIKRADKVQVEMVEENENIIEIKIILEAENY